MQSQDEEVSASRTEKVIALVQNLWRLLLDYVGATDEASKWWKSVFERRILKGNVGVGWKWQRSPVNDILWEFESFVENLSQEDLSTARPLEQVTAATKPLSSSRSGSEESCMDQDSVPQKMNTNSNKGRAGKVGKIANHPELHELYSDSPQTNVRQIIGHFQSLISGDVVLKKLLREIELDEDTGRFDDGINDDAVTKHQSGNKHRRSKSDALSSRRGPFSTAKPSPSLPSLIFETSKNVTYIEDLDVAGMIPDTYENDLDNYVEELLRSFKYFDDNNQFQFCKDNVEDTPCVPVKNNRQENREFPFQFTPGSPSRHRRAQRSKSGVYDKQDNRSEPRAPDRNESGNFSIIGLEQGSSLTTKESDVDYVEHPVPMDCPIPDCRVPDCLLKSRSVQSDKRKNTLFPPPANIMKRINDTLRKIIINDDTPVFINKPVTRTNIVGVDISHKVRNRSSYKAGLKNSKSVDLNSFLEPVKFDISIKPQTGPANPIETIQRGLGFEKLKLPKEPSNIVLPTEPQEASSPIWQQSLVKLRIAGQWLKSQLSAGPSHDTTPAIITTSVRNPLHDSKIDLTDGQYCSLYYLTGRKAYLYYKLLTMTEAKYRINELIEEREKLLRIYEWKQRTLMEVVKIARDYYSDPTDVHLDRWKTLKRDLSKDHQSYTDVRMQVSSIPDYWPFFTIMIIMCQILMLFIVIAKYGIDANGVGTIRRVRLGIPTFLGTETFSALREPNPWLGPPIKAFAAAGGIVAACMREDKRLSRITKLKGYKIMTREYKNYFGCCEMLGHFNIAGTTTYSECSNMTTGLGAWHKGIICSRRPATKNSVAHIIKPCCVGLFGECEMVSHEHCTFIGGTFHVECDHCVQLNCLNDVCQVKPYQTNIVPYENHPWLPGPDTYWQWWRFITAIPLTYGIIHLLCLVPMEVMLMIPLETCAGWHRVFIIYGISSMAGEAVASIVEPDLPHVGSTSGMGGILGVAVLELLQAWKFIRYPFWEGIKLSVLIGMQIFLGTLQLVNLFSFFAGLGVGMMSCLMIVPYITFGRTLSHLRFRLVMLGFCLLVPTLILIQLTFKFIQEIRQCPNCVALECIPYTSVMCKTYKYWN